MDTRGGRTLRNYSVNTGQLVGTTLAALDRPCLLGGMPGHVCPDVIVEAGFNHPIANAIVAYAVEHNVQPLPVTDADYLPGQGVMATVQGQQVFLGVLKRYKLSV